MNGRDTLRRTRRTAAVLAAVALMLGLTSGNVIAAAPDNDDIATPRLVDAVPYSNGPYLTTDATTGATDPTFCFDSPDRSTVWYSFTPETTAAYVADTFGSDYDTTLYVGTPDGSGGMSGIDCNDDASDVQSAVVWQATAGTEYLLMIGTCCGGGTVGEAGGGGTLEFHVDVAPPPPTLNITIDGRGTLTADGVVTVGGSVTCENGEVPGLDVVVTQRVGRFLIRGFGFAGGVSCDGAAQPWQADVSGETGRFGGGRVTVDVFAAACGVFSCAVDTETRTVRLRH
jgi:hypothetical protein